MHTVDRTNWKSGAWDDEPDRVEWRYRGLPCLIVRNEMGALCGYVGVPVGSPATQAGDDELDVHGGITFGGECKEGGRICHVPREGESDHIYWIGFDCCHAGDLVPSRHMPAWESDVYRDVAYVTAEVQRLADQAIELNEKRTIGGR